MVDTGVDLGIRILTPDQGRPPDRVVSSRLGNNITDFLQQIRNDPTKGTERRMVRSFDDIATVPRNLEESLKTIPGDVQLTREQQLKYATLFILRVCTSAPYTVGNTLEYGPPQSRSILDVQKATLSDFVGMVDTEYGMLLGCIANGPGDEKERIKRIRTIDQYVQEVVLAGKDPNDLLKKPKKSVRKTVPHTNDPVRPNNVNVESYEDGLTYNFYVDLDHAYGIFGAAFRRRDNDKNFKDRTMTWIIETRSDKTDTRPVLTSKMSLNYLVRNYAPCIRGGIVFPDNRSKEIAPFLREDGRLIEAFAENGIRLDRAQSGNDENGYDVGSNSLSFRLQGTPHFEYDNVEMGKVLKRYDFSYRGGEYQLVFAESAYPNDGSARGTNICCYVETAKSNWGTDETATIFRRNYDKNEEEVVKLSQLMEISLNTVGKLLQVPLEYGKVRVLTKGTPPPHFS